MANTLRTMVCMLAVTLVGLTAQAREIDNEKTVSTEQIQLGQALPKTVVIRIKAGTNEAEVMHAATALPGAEASKALVSSSSFVKLDKNGKMIGELDRDGSSSSWYFCYPYSYYPYYGYYGYNYYYRPYYSYYYSGYYYSYYGWPYYNPYCAW